MGPNNIKLLGQYLRLILKIYSYLWVKLLVSQDNYIDIVSHYLRRRKVQLSVA